MHSRGVCRSYAVITCMMLADDMLFTLYTTLDLDKLGILSLLDMKYDSFLVL